MAKRKAVSESKRQAKTSTRATRRSAQESSMPNPDNPGTLVANEHGITSTDESQLVDNSGGHQGDVNSINGVRGNSTQSVESDVKATSASAGGDCDARIEAALEKFKQYLAEEKEGGEQPETEEPVKEEETPPKEETGGNINDKDEWTADNMSVADTTKFTASAFTIIKSGESYSLLHIYVNPLGGEEARMKVVKEGLEKEAAVDLLKQYSAKEIFDKLI